MGFCCFCIFCPSLTLWKKYNNWESMLFWQYSMAAMFYFLIYSQNIQNDVTMLHVVSCLFLYVIFQSNDTNKLILEISFQLLSRLNKIGLALSTSSKQRLIEECGTSSKNKLIDYLRGSPLMKITGDCCFNFFFSLSVLSRLRWMSLKARLCDHTFCRQRRRQHFVKVFQTSITLSNLDRIS